MKEVRVFYAPDAPVAIELPEEEAVHAVRVLRLEQGDGLMLADGRGTFYKAVITETTKKRCLYRITETMPQPRQWKGHLHIAMAPTKNMSDGIRIHKSVQQLFIRVFQSFFTDSRLIRQQLQKIFIIKRDPNLLSQLLPDLTASAAKCP